MSARILEGAPVAAAIDAAMAARVRALKARGTTPTLGILRVGERADDLAYERGAVKRAESIGLAVEQIVLDAASTQEDILAAVRAANESDAINGLLMLRPLPPGIDETLVSNTLVAHKDVDGMTSTSLTSIFTGSGDGFAPCTAQACLELLDYYHIPLEGKHVVVVGRSLVVGKPLALMCLARNATVTLAHSHTRNLAELTRRADVVVACVGHARMLDGSHFSAGQVVIDVGINLTTEGTMAGDVNFEQTAQIVDALTPVPRGVGSVTTSVVCKHVVEATEAASETASEIATASATASATPKANSTAHS